LQHHPAHRQVEFESLMGLGTEQLDALQRRGFQTREYAIFGQEYFLYVLNRIAEEPTRLFQAVVDLIGSPAPGTGPASPPDAA
jgi:proline dehydrogenase